MEFQAPPLLRECIEQKRNPFDFVLMREILGWRLIIVPLALMDSRVAARAAYGILAGLKPEDLFDLRPRNIDDRLSWVMAYRIVS